MNPVITVLLALTLASQQPAVTGVVLDQSGAAVAGATVIVRGTLGIDEQTVSGPDGRFSLFRKPSAGAMIIVRAGGFAEKAEPLTSDHVEIVIAPARLLETVTVTPSRTEERIANIPASINPLAICPALGPWRSCSIALRSHCSLPLCIAAHASRRRSASVLALPRAVLLGPARAG
jgi:hypothetical protein